MKLIISNKSLCLIAAFQLAACSSSDAPTGPGFAIGVAPLTLPSITDTCYRLTVTNGPNRTGDIVFQQDNICADQFGDGVASISYVGPCDADAPGPNSVTIELLDLKSGSPTPAPIDDDEYDNPCGEVLDWSTPAGRNALLLGEDLYGPCTIDKVCVENTDVPVEFNITVMRDAEQGFVDIALDFQDVFCSAKVDCAPQLLHDSLGVRGPTAVVALACTAGENEQTNITISDLRITCDGTPAMAPIVIPAAAATPGQHGPINPGIYEWAAYQGDEQLTSNDQPLEKCYWNRAIGLDLTALAGRNCMLSGAATVSEAPLTLATLNAEGVSYPVITFNVPIVTAAGALCQPNPLNELGSGVQTAYVGEDTNALLLAGLVGGASFACGAPEPLSCVAGPLVPTSGLPDVVNVALDGTALTVQTGTSSQTVTLPAGFTLAGCHLDNCCTQ